MKGFALACALSVAITAGAFSATSAAENYVGAFLSGNQLHDFCRSNRSAASFFVIGTADALLFWDRTLKAKNLCLPLNVSSEQLTDVVCQKLEAEPGGRNNAASGITTVALMSAWPCR